jgi:1,4-alpha-glucan branching enzyme
VNRRWQERTVTYCESHDQALVGDKTLAFWLMDADMYWHMRAPDAATPPASPTAAGAAQRTQQTHVVIDRGIALHKMIRLLTCALGGEAYLNFMGNEFGHPEWIDFPRAGNGWSFHYCRRQWSLVDNPALRYAGLGEFDRAMQSLDKDYGLLTAGGAEWISEHEEHKLIVFRRAGLVFAFNWHPVRSEAALRIPVGPRSVGWKVVLSSDDVSTGGFGTAPHGQEYGVLADVGGAHISLHLPARTAVVLREVSGSVR